MSAATLVLLLGALIIIALFRAADPFRIAAMRRAMRSTQLTGLFLAVDSGESLHLRGLRTRKIMDSLETGLRKAGIRRLSAPVHAGQGCTKVGNLVCVLRGCSLPWMPLCLVVSRMELYQPASGPYGAGPRRGPGWSSQKLSLVHPDTLAANPLPMVSAMLQRFPGGPAPLPGNID